jgi:hypothetical protein
MLMEDPEVGVRILGLGLFENVIKHFQGILFWAGSALTMASMIKLRHQQPSLWHSGLAADIEDLREPWMRLVDRLLEDELLDTIYEAQGERYPQSRRRAASKRRPKWCCVCGC